jgi:hypothetical protein
VNEPDEVAVVTGEIVKRSEVARTAPAADMRYTDDTVTRVFVRVEYADGRIREYQAQEPQDFQMSTPMAVHEAGFKISAGGLFKAPSFAVSSLRLSFTAHPKWNLHIRTEATAPEDFPGITYGL